MLKKKAFRRIFITTIIFFIVFVVLSIKKLEGPTNIETMIKENNNNSLLPTYFNPILPRNTKILEVVLDNDLIKINFSKEFNNVTESQYKKMVEAITYTLTDIKGINGVELYVDNKIVKYIPNTTTILPTILTKDIGINKVYEIKDTANIKKTIIYFLGGNSKNYVPVTKYLNNRAIFIFFKIS